MATRRNTSSSPFDEERPFTTAWGEYNPRQSSAWSDNGSTPDWARPYEFPTSTGHEAPKNRHQYDVPRTPRTPSNNTVSWTQWRAVEKPSRALAVVLAVVFGTFGVHRFYIGDNVTGAIMAGISILSFGGMSWVSTVWGFVDAINFLRMSDNEFSHYCYEKRQVTA